MSARCHGREGRFKDRYIDNRNIVQYDRNCKEWDSVCGATTESQVVQQGESYILDAKEVEGEMTQSHVIKQEQQTMAKEKDSAAASEGQ